MLLGEAPGRGAPGRAAPGRGATGRGIGRSTGCADENGLLPTRGGRTPGLGAGPGRGPADVPGGGAAGLACWPGICAVGCPEGGTDGRPAGDAGASRGAVGGAWPAAVGATAAESAAGADAAVAAPLPATFSIALSRARSRVRSSDSSRRLAGAFAATFSAPLSAAGLLPPNDSRSRRATGASTVDDADLTNSPCSFSRARTSLLVTPSSLANSCTRALPATTSPVYEATVVGRASGISCNASRWGSSGLHGVLIFFATCSVAGTIGRTEKLYVLDHRGCVR